ncbi:MAG: ATP-binding protein, partial [Paludibacter sp.]
KRFTVKDGLFTSAMLEGMHIDRQNDLLYVGTTNGLNIINTAGQSSNPYPAKVQIADFLIYGKSIKSNPELYQHLKAPLYNTNEIKLNYKENNFSINFLATHYNDFDKNMYVYKLEGYDTDSITTDYKNRTASYNNLPAGTYRFWVKASNNDNNWRGEKQYLTIVVKSAPWLTIWAFIIYICLAGLIIRVIFQYLNRETKLKQQLVIKEIEGQHETEINNMKLRFHTNIAHDIRTPLTLISAPLEDIKNNHSIISNPFLNDRIGIIEKNVSRLLYLVNQFLDFRRLLNDGSTLHPETHFAPTAFTDIKESFIGFAKSKKIRYEFVIDINDHYLIFDLDKLTKILFNLISNSFKFTPDGGDIYVFIEQQNKSLVLKVVDTGCGIPEKDLPNIFQRFYQAADSNNGTGIGLSLVKQLVDLCQGTIDIESKERQGTQFTINIPIEIAWETNMEELKIEIEEEEDLTTQIQEDEHRKATVLVVEDDNDLRSYLVKSLVDKYSVFESVNGQDGFDKALRYTPDIIISDIMMPQVDGITLIKMVRNDYRTSHIPIIVLTAKTGENAEINALEAGAEDFIAKPFSSKSLMLKVNNYLRNLSSRNKEGGGIEEAKLLDREQLFLNKMNKVILNNLESPIFSIDFICDKMAISRMQLHRKMVALLGKSTSEYIREIKLDEAKKYFEKGERDIETVMLKIGVNSSFHFNKNFKVRFGVTIQDFIKSKNNKNT